MGMSLEALTAALLQDIGIDEETTSELAPNYGPCEESALKVRATYQHFDQQSVWVVDSCGTSL